MELLTDTNSITKKTRWAFTLTCDDVDKAETTEQAGVAATLLGHPCRVIIGPIEMADEVVGVPHRHCMIIRPGSGMTRGQARRSVEEFLPGVNTEEYFKAVMNHNRYVNYMFKSVDPMKTYAEKELKKLISAMTEEGTAITPKNLKHEISAKLGPHFYTKNKGLVDVMLGQPDLFGPCVTVPFETNPSENYTNAMKVLLVFNNVAKRAIKQHGYICTAAGYENMEPYEMANLITILSGLPFLRQRWEGVDALPGIFLWGAPGTGKSHLFQNAPYYKKVASDAQGVSRYRLDGCQRAFLLDDVTPAFFDDRMNMSTLRQLTLGGSATVKTMGDTSEVRGWITATSNDTPIWLLPEPPKDQEDNPNWERNCGAWKRRFIFVQVTETLDVNPIAVNWHHASAVDAVRDCLVGMNDAIPANIKEKLNVYMSHLMLTMEDDWDNRANAALGALAPEMEEIFKEKDCNEVLMQAAKRKVWPEEKPKKAAKKAKTETVDEESWLAMEYCPTTCYMVHKHKYKL
jgi:hypothetical protein